MVSAMSVSGSGCSTSALETASFASPDVSSCRKFLSRNLYLKEKSEKKVWATRYSECINWEGHDGLNVRRLTVCKQIHKSITGHFSRLYVCDKGSRLGRHLIAHSLRPTQLSDFHRLFWQEGSGVQGMIKNTKTVLNQHNSDLVRPFFFFFEEGREAHRL